MKKYVLILFFLVLLLIGVITILPENPLGNGDNILKTSPARMHRDNYSTTVRTPEDSQNQLRCQKDSDCSCGSDIVTKRCAYGNKKFIDETKQCPDFCTGIAGKLRIKCISNECTQVTIK